jgi:hypothetical protein
VARQRRRRRHSCRPSTARQLLRGGGRRRRRRLRQRGAGEGVQGGAQREAVVPEGRLAVGVEAVPLDALRQRRGGGRVTR